VGPADNLRDIAADAGPGEAVSGGMTSPFVHIRQEYRASGVVAHLTLDNQARLNTLSSAVMDAFVAAFARLAEDETLRAVVLTGAGTRAFVGGADVDEMAAIASPAEARAFIARVHACCAAVRDLPVPVIAVIRGWCLGAGLELAAACDLRLADATARFGMPEVRLGIPSVVEAALLPGLIGWARTREMLLFGESVDAAEALRIGLIDACVAPGDLDAVAAARVASLLEATPRAIRLQKALIRRWEDLPLGAAIAAGIDAFGEAFETDEPREAMAAFRAARAARRGG
jgi:enoyl-CoA hydratase/carnithine racemase